MTTDDHAAIMARGGSRWAKRVLLEALAVSDKHQMKMPAISPDSGA